MAKELPIQIVELRQDQDDFKPEGGVAINYLNG